MGHFIQTTTVGLICMVVGDAALLGLYTNGTGEENQFRCLLKHQHHKNPKCAED